MINHPSLYPVLVSCGPNEARLLVAGYSVGAVKVACIEWLSIPYFSDAVVNGCVVTTEFILGPADSLVFWNRFGCKGAGGDSTTTKARALIEAYSEFAEVTDQIKSLDLDTDDALDELLRRIIPICERRFGPFLEDEMMTITEVASLLGCCYGEARNRMLEGRIKSVKDGRWHRSRREWVEEYIERNSIFVDPEKVNIPIVAGRKQKSVGVKPNSIALRFLRERRG